MNRIGPSWLGEPCLTISSTVSTRLQLSSRAMSKRSPVTSKVRKFQKDIWCLQITSFVVDTDFEHKGSFLLQFFMNHHLQFLQLCKTLQFPQKNFCCVQREDTEYRVIYSLHSLRPACTSWFSISVQKRPFYLINLLWSMNHSENWWNDLPN